MRSLKLLVRPAKTGPAGPLPTAMHMYILFTLFDVHIITFVTVNWLMSILLQFTCTCLLR